MKRISLFILLATILYSCNKNETQEWISFHSYFKSDPFIISFVNDSIIKFIDANFDSKLIKYDVSKKKIAILSENDSVVGKIDFISNSKIELFLNYIQGPITFNPIRKIDNYGMYSTNEIRKKLNSVWNINFSIKDNKQLECNIDFIDYKKSIVSFKDSSGNYNNFKLISWDVLDYNSFIILRLFDESPRFFIVYEIKDEQIVLYSIVKNRIELVKLNRVVQKSNSNLDLEKTIWNVEYSYNENSIFKSDRNYLNYKSLKFENQTYSFSNFNNDSDNNSYFGRYRLSSDLGFILFYELNDLFEIHYDNQNSLIFKKVNSKDPFNIILKKQETDYLILDDLN